MSTAAATPSTDRIHKHIVLTVNRSRVWQALTNVDQFGEWFGVDLGQATFTPGARVQGRMRNPDWAHIPFEVTVEQMEPERLMSWRWHPDPSDPAFDYAAEPATLVVWQLEDHPAGTLLTVDESGFDALSPARRANAFRGNSEGWTEQLAAITSYVSRARP